MLCEFCKQNTVPEKKSRRPLRFCSRTCASRHSCLERKKTNLEKYGVENVSQSPEILSRRENNYLTKWGHKNPSQCADFLNQVREKQKRTCLKKYGVDHSSKSPLIQEKIKNSWHKYQGSHPWSDPEVREQRRISLVENYGVEHPILNEEIKEKIKNTNLEKWGFENAAKSPEVRLKISQTNSTPEITDKTQQTSWERYGAKHFNQRHIQTELAMLNTPEWLTEQVAQLGFVGVSVLLAVSIDTVRKYANLHQITPPSKSCFETEILHLIQKHYTEEIITNQRLWNNKEIDIYIPKLKLAFECNGSYWHSEINGRPRNYHLEKTLIANENGVHLVHLWEHDWRFKQEITRSRILSLLGLNEKIPARKCQISEATPKESQDFLNQNHIQFFCPSSIKLGLYYQGQLTSLMTFGRSRFSKHAQWELLRFVNLKGVTVVGGASKLFKYFVTQHQPDSVISYSDRSFNRGNVYQQLGFTKQHSSPPTYYYTRDYKFFENRMKFQKHKLENLMSIFDAQLSEWEIMKLNGYDRIWDCGNDVWMWKNK